MNFLSSGQKRVELLQEVVSSLFLDLFQTSFSKPFVKNVLEGICVAIGLNPQRVSWEKTWALCMTEDEYSLTSFSVDFRKYKCRVQRF